MKNVCYCLKCRRHTGSTDVKEKVNKRGGKYMSSICVECGARKSKMLPK